MEIPIEAQRAAWKITDEYGRQVTPNELVSMALRAAFDTVPDPITDEVRSDIERMVKVHRTHDGGWGQYPMGEVAARVDAFLRGVK